MWVSDLHFIVLSGEETFEKDLSKSPTLGRGKQGSKMDMMMMMSDFVFYLIEYLMDECCTEDIDSV